MNIVHSKNQSFVCLIQKEEMDVIHLPVKWSEKKTCEREKQTPLEAD